MPKKVLTSMLWPQLCPVFFTDYSVEESYQPRDYLAATMQFMPGHFACEVVWSTLIHVHSRLKMGPNMGVSRGTYSPGFPRFGVSGVRLLAGLAHQRRVCGIANVPHCPQLSRHFARCSTPSLW